MQPNTSISRRAFLTTSTAALLCARRMAAATALASLKEAYRSAFLIGAALDFRRPDEFDAVELALMTSQFNVMTPENSMKPGPIHPQEDTWNWTQPEALLQFCENNAIKTVGHCLVWHSQTGAWFFDGANREIALRRLRSHITTLVGRFKGRIMGWDVVNEAINDGGNDMTAVTENLRDTRWLRTVGPDYLVQAFKFAREADPDVALLYNDYSIESGPKHQSSLLLLKRLIGEGAPITTVGIQGHWNVAGLTPQKFEQIDQAIERYRALKLTVTITELDVTLTGAGGGQLRGVGPGPVEPPSADALQAQAEAYAKLFAIFVRHRDAIDRVTFWGLNDRRSWRRGQSPLLFDGNNLPKPAFDAVIGAAPR